MALFRRSASHGATAAGSGGGKSAAAGRRAGGGGGNPHVSLRTPQHIRYLLLVAVTFMTVTCCWMAPAVGATRQLKQSSSCGPPCFPSDATTATSSMQQLDTPVSGCGGSDCPPYDSMPRTLLGSAKFDGYTQGASTGSGPGEYMAALQPAIAAAHVTPPPVAAVAQATAVAPVAVAPMMMATPTVVGSGGINVISSNPIKISNPITIKNPNVNHDLNKVGALGGATSGGGAGKAAFLNGAADLISAIGAFGGAVLGR